MALKPCRECKKEISTDVVACPACGKKNPHGKTSTVAWVGLFLVVLFGYAMCRSIVSDPHPPRVAASTPQPVSNISWSEIDAIYGMSSKTTELQKEAEWARFEGKRVRWSGRVTEVSDSLGQLTLQVRMNENTLTSDVLVRLRDSARSSAMQLRQGQRVTFEGTLVSWGSILPTSLDDGEIVADQWRGQK
jgi:RNA polymerase subunit RPABC4/transcription elongation factor Spt4